MSKAAKALAFGMVTAGSVGGYIAGEAASDYAHSGAVDRYKAATASYEDWVAKLGEAAVARDEFMLTLPAGCQGALEPYYFYESGKSVPDGEVAEAVQQVCAINADEVTIARESLNNIMRLRTIVDETNQDVSVKKSEKNKSSYFFPQGLGILLGSVISYGIYSNIRAKLGLRKYRASNRRFR